jgi:hypothetical protein
LPGNSPKPAAGNPCRGISSAIATAFTARYLNDYYDVKYPIKSRLIQVDKPWIADQTHAWINASIVRLQREQNAKAEKAIRQGAKKIDKRRAFLFRRLDYQFLELIDDDTISTSE